MSIFGRADNQRIHAVSQDGARTPVDGDGIVAAFGDGRELRIEFSRHPSSEDGVVLLSDYRPPLSTRATADSTGPPEFIAKVVVHPGGGNIMQAGVAAFRWGDGVLVAGEGMPATAPPSLFVVTGEARTPVDAKSLVMDLGGERDLTVELWRGDPGRERVSLQAGRAWDKDHVAKLIAGESVPCSSLVVQFGGCNVVHVVVERHGSALVFPEN